MYKTFTIAAVLTVFATSANADEKEHLCNVYSDLASTAVEKRYDGVELSRMINLASNKIEKEIVIGAFDFPYLPSSEQKQSNRYANKIYKRCYRSF